MQNQNYITREEAVSVIYDLINSGILSEAHEEALQDIASCIKHENDNLFLWGANVEVSKLFTSVRSDLKDEAWEDACEKLYQPHHKTPCFSNGDIRC